MNWYKTIKIALPVVTTPSYMHYTDIGHKKLDQGRGEILWTIDYNWNFEAIPVTEEIEGEIHDDVFQRNFDYVTEDSIASGRLFTDLANRTRVSATINIDPRKTNPRRMEYIKEQVTRILDREFNNPDIMFFE